MSKIPIHLEEDYACFLKLWEYKSETNYPATQKWNERANEWRNELRGNKAVRESNKERVLATMVYLENHHLLNSTDSVIDIGCGPGRFVVEFAKRVKTVVACDISDKMLDLAKEYAEEENITNVQFLLCDFLNVAIEKQQWLKKFDLVFTSITPAIGSLGAIEKINQMSRHHVFNSCLLHQQDSIVQRLAKEVFCIETPKKEPIRIGIMPCLIYYGYKDTTLKTYYYKQHRTEVLDNGEMLANYYMRFFEDYDIPNKQEMITNYLN